MTHTLRADLDADLAERLDRAPADVVLLALHVGCWAFALDITGRVEPVRHGDSQSAGRCARVEDLAAVVNGDVIYR